MTRARLTVMLGLFGLSALFSAGMAAAADCRETAGEIARAKTMVRDIRHDIEMDNLERRRIDLRMDRLAAEMERLQCSSLLDVVTNIADCKRLRGDYRALVNETTRLLLKNGSDYEELNEWLSELDELDETYATCTVTETTIEAQPPATHSEPEPSQEAAADNCTLGSKFDHYPHQAIPANNIGSLPNTSVEDCKAACLARAGCKSFDYGRKNNYCVLSDKNTADLKRMKTGFVGRPAGAKEWAYDDYERVCR